MVIDFGKHSDWLVSENMGRNQGDQQGPFRGGTKWLLISRRLDKSTSDGTAGLMVHATRADRSSHEKI